MSELVELAVDAAHERLRAAIEVEETSYLWIKGDTPPFTPRLLPTAFGDGRALFAIATIAYFVLSLPVYNVYMPWGWWILLATEELIYAAVIG